MLDLRGSNVDCFPGAEARKGGEMMCRYWSFIIKLVSLKLPQLLQQNVLVFLYICKYFVGLRVSLFSCSHNMGERDGHIRL